MSDGELSPQLADLDDAGSEVIAALRRLVDIDPDLAMAESLVVNEVLEQLAEQVADQRALAADTIRVREGDLSLSQLGVRLKMSKPRAQQLVERARRLRGS